MLFRNFRESILIKLRKNIKLFSFIIIVISSVFISGCKNDTSDLGLEFISNDTLGTLVLDSQLDTMNITSNNFVKYINTSSSYNLLVGNYQNYQSRTLLRFKNISADYDSSTVYSAVLHLKYNDVFFQDSLGITSFNIYKLTKYYPFDTLTYAGFSNSDIGLISIGTYTGTLTDTNSINITLDNQTVQDWLNYAADTNYINKNYGIILVPNLNSTTIKSFYSPSYGTNNPNITIVRNKYSVTDTINIGSADFNTLSYVPTTIIPNGEFVLQNGVSFKNILKFDISKLPGKVIINNASLVLKLDKANSFITKNADVHLNADPRLIANMLTDTSTLTNDGLNYYSVASDSITYTIVLNPAFQKWNNGVATNLGIIFRNIYDYSNIDRYVFYSPNYSDASKRPKLRIRYTIRR